MTTVPADDFNGRLSAVAAQTERALERLLADATLPGEVVRPPRLVAAMHHAALGGGKRLRPFLVVESAALAGATGQGPLLAGCALECLHCYSLVHDDLPSMDNDDLRRGQPTVHKKFDEATAILAGDGLLTLAFDILARPEVHPSADVRIALVLELARASGLGGMVGGQMLDLAAEGRFEAKRELSEDEIVTLQAMKTGALLRFACRAGGILGKRTLQRATRSIAMARRSDRHFKSPTTCSTSKAIPRRSAKPQAKTLPRARGHWYPRSGSKARMQSLMRWSPKRKALCSRSEQNADVLRSAARFIAQRRT